MTTARQAYVNAVVRNYVRLPGTPLRASRRDRKLAAALYDRRVPRQVVWMAFVIAATRWAIRTPQQRKLEVIRTLYYFVPAAALRRRERTSPGRGQRAMIGAR